MRVPAHARKLPAALARARHIRPGDVVCDREIKLTPGARLRLRLVVARGREGFKRLHRRITGGGLEAARGSHGIVYNMATEYVFPKPRMEHHPRYFAVILLDATQCRPEVVAHECGHAALFYARRCKGNKWHGRVPADDEAGEAVCYPLGVIFRRVNIALHDAGVWGGK